jgi:hypothetical protein
MVSSVIDFICIRIQAELDKFEKTKTLPHDLLDGIWSIDDIEKCKPHMSIAYQKRAEKLIKEYSQNMHKDLASLRESLKKEYAHGLKNSRTRSQEFIFPNIMKKYRTDINPIRAIYYETRNMVRRYNPDNHNHQWLAELVTDKAFNNTMLDALEHDIKRIEKILKRYYWPLLKLNEKQIPLELFHARQHIKDARYYYEFFLNMQDWMPDE